MIRQIDQLSIDLFFAANEMTLNFDVDIFATERIDKKLRAFRRFADCDKTDATRPSEKSGRVRPNE